MDILNGFVNQFCPKHQIDFFQEDFEIFETRYKLESIVVPNEQLLIDSFNAFEDSDTCTIYINIEESDDDIAFYKGADFTEFKTSLEVKIRGIEPNNIIILKVRIEKRVLENKLSIYSIVYFETYLAKFTTFDLIDFFSEKIKAHGTIIFKSKEILQASYSASLGFEGKMQTDQSVKVWNKNSRYERLKNIQSTTHAILLSDKLIIPEDFQFNQTLPELLKQIFERIDFALIIIAIFDVTNLVDNKLTFRINGYKSIDGMVDLLSIPINDHIDEYRKIYNWINESGNLNDKLGLARNIISLHLNPANDLSFTGNIFSSVLSAYKVYEKQNIRQYIEIRNKMSDQLLDFNKRANTVVEGFASTFQKSALSVLTLFSSIIALKLLGNTSTSANFVTYSSIFSIIIIVISLIYMIISRTESFEQKARYEKSYQNFKERYTDLLNSEDINRILNKDKDFNDDIIYINNKIRNYTIQWAVVLSLIFIFIVIYFLTEKWMR
jgi:hypothetical protein